MEKEEFYYDVQTCIQMLKEIHPLLSDAKVFNKLDKVAKDALDSIGCEYTRENVYLVISKICAVLQDGHTCIRDLDKDKLAIKFRIIDGNVYVVNHKYNCDLLYKKVIGINSIDVDEVILRMQPYLHYETDEGKLWNIETFLTNLSMLKALGIVHDKCVINTKDNDYDIFNTERLSNWKKRIVYNKFEALNEDTVYFKYGLCGPADNVKTLTLNAIEYFESRKVKKVIFDLRGNFGGNSSYINEFMGYLAEYILNNNTKIIALIDRYVYSSAVFAVAQLEKLGATFVGERVARNI